MNFSISSSTKSYVVFLSNIFPDQLAQPTTALHESDDDNLLDMDRDLTHAIDIDQDLDELLLSSSWSNKFDTTVDDLELIPATSVVEQTIQPITRVATVLDELPRQYYNTDRLIKTTNLACWGCGSGIMHQPWLLPISVDRTDLEPGDQEQDFSTSKEIHLDLSDFRKQQMMEITKRSKQIKIMKTNGIFCHVWCIGRYLKGPNDLGINTWQTSELVREMFKSREGRELIAIPVSESPRLMSRYSGPSGLTEEQYYQMNYKNLISYIQS